MYISFDIGGTTIKYGVVNNDGEIVFQDKIKTEDNKENFFNNMKELIVALRQRFDILGIGISAPGIIRKDGLMITAGAIKSLYGENIKKEIEAFSNLPVTIENDANAAAIAEKWLGNAKDLTNYICLVLGTGVGGSIVINNQIYSGSNGMAGEFGWTLINDLPVSGDIESSTLNKKSAVVNGLCANYNRQKRLLEPSVSPIYDAQLILDLEKQGDVVAKDVLTDFFTNLAVGIINVMSSFDPDAILIGGGISANEEFRNRLLAMIKEVKSRHQSMNNLSSIIETPVILAKLKNDAGIIGAAYQIKEKIDKNDNQ
ncbi:MAG: ROK family protein [Vagococcus sp.]|uniref:ROK family protein n=1 Tax=Vagococcus TaxID=2737 RepID=UPI002FCA212D